MKTRGIGNNVQNLCPYGSPAPSRTSMVSSSRSYSSSCMTSSNHSIIVKLLGNNNQIIHSNLNPLGQSKDRNLIHSLLFILCFCFMLHFVSPQFYDPPTNLQLFTTSESRRWIISGNFSSIIVNNSTSYTNLNNIAVWNGNSWKGMGNGTNGLVRTHFIDTCYNMYVGGDFNRVGELTTGPLARWSISRQRWESITDDVVWSEGSSVRSVTVDCFNTPSESSRCYCNVWIAGKFEMQIANSTTNATNLALYQGKTNTWYSMREESDHNLTLSMTVNTIFKRDFGQTFNSRKTFVGGEFPFILTWDPYYKIWERIEMGNSTTNSTITNATVNHIFFHKAILDYSLFDYWNYIISGEFEFNFTMDNTTYTCKNLCMLEFRHGTWVPLLPDDQVQALSGYVKHVSTSDNNLCAVGDFHGDGISNLVSITQDGIDYQKFNTTIIDEPFKAIYVCKEVDLDCSTKSAGLADKNGALWFYDSETTEFHKFSQLKDGGVVERISSIFLYDLKDKM